MCFVCVVCVLCVLCVSAGGSAEHVDIRYSWLMRFREAWWVWGVNCDLDCCCNACKV